MDSDVGDSAFDRSVRTVEKESSSPDDGISSGISTGQDIPGHPPLRRDDDALLSGESEAVVAAAPPVDEAGLSLRNRAAVPVAALLQDLVRRDEERRQLGPGPTPSPGPDGPRAK
jgi:hypothetical protein